MNATLSMRQLRLVGLLVLVVVAVGGYLVASKHRSTTASSTPVATKPATTTPAPSNPPHTSTPAGLATHGLPLVVAQALRKHAVVVVSLYSPGAGVDQVVGAEARAGALAMGAGYVDLDVFHQRNGTAVLRKLGVVDTPAVLVVKRPHAILADFHGVVDRSIVEQAVVDAR